MVTHQSNSFSSSSAESPYLSRGYDGFVNLVSLVGTVYDRPFRPGAGQRTVVKVKCDGESGRSERLEFDAFGQAGDFGMKLRVGDAIAVRGRVEDRTYRDGDEKVNELRLVADYIELLVPASHRHEPGERSEPPLDFRES
jgi:hypothetical protein